jgi:hypothetical protein
VIEAAQTSPMAAFSRIVVKIGKDVQDLATNVGHDRA